MNPQELLRKWRYEIITADSSDMTVTQYIIRRDGEEPAIPLLYKDFKNCYDLHGEEAARNLIKKHFSKIMKKFEKYYDNQSDI
jgi:hypothetical protein